MPELTMRWTWSKGPWTQAAPERSMLLRPVQSHPMFVARPFALNNALAAQACGAARASTTKTTTIKG